MDAKCNERFSDLGNYLSETSKHANIEMTIVDKNEVNLPTHYHKYKANNRVYFISQKWEGDRNQRRKRREKMDYTNRKCIFENDLLHGTQSNGGFSAAAAVSVGFFGHILMPPYNCPFFHIVYFSCTFYVLTSFEQKERLPTNVTLRTSIYWFHCSVKTKKGVKLHDSKTSKNTNYFIQ